MTGKAEGMTGVMGAFVQRMRTGETGATGKQNAEDDRRQRTGAPG